MGSCFRTTAQFCMVKTMLDEVVTVSIENMFELDEKIEDAQKNERGFIRQYDVLMGPPPVFW